MNVFSKPTLEQISLSQRLSEFATLAQISDLHLFENPQRNVESLTYQNNFTHILNLIKNYPVPIDLLVVSGDLVHEVTQTNYDNIFTQLDLLDVPYVCVAGNHDVTQELDSELPFPQRRHLAMPLDARLASCVKVSLPHWDVLLLDSSVAGEVYGYLDEASLTWLQSQLATTTKPCIIFAHHPMVSVNAKWIDASRLKNADTFWEVVTPYADRIKGIFVGHIHQEKHIIHQGISLFSTPATSVQFAPLQDEFTIDTQKTAGLRWITLYNNANLATGVKRIDTM